MSLYLCSYRTFSRLEALEHLIARHAPLLMRCGCGGESSSMLRRKMAPADEKRVCALYREHRSTSHVAELTGWSVGAIARCLRRHGILMQKHGGAMGNRNARRNPGYPVAIAEWMALPEDQRRGAQRRLAQKHGLSVTRLSSLLAAERRALGARKEAA